MSALLKQVIGNSNYWRIKQQNILKSTLSLPDEDGTLTTTYLPKKGRAIVEIDLDGTYVLTEADLEESDKVKLFEHFIEDFKQLIEDN